MFYDEDTVTDQPQRQIVAEIIREKALHALDAEIPHGIAVAIDRMKTRPGKNPIVDIDATIICERESHKGIIIGKQGAMLKKIGSNARYEIERMITLLAEPIQIFFFCSLHKAPLVLLGNQVIHLLILVYIHVLVEKKM